MINGNCTEGARCRYSHRPADVTDRILYLTYDHGPGDIDVKGAIKIVIHVGGIDYGPLPANCAATVYVGNGSDVTCFRDPHKDEE